MAVDFGDNDAIVWDDDEGALIRIEQPSEYHLTTVLLFKVHKKNQISRR